MASKTDIANAALAKIGAVPISNLESNAGSVERVINRNFELAVREAGERVPWACLTKFADLTQSGTAPFKWAYSYAKPVGLIRINQFNQITVDHQVSDQFQLDERYVYTDEDTAQVEYNYYHENTGLYSPLFIEAIAWSLAAKIAPTITGGISDMDSLLKGFETAIGRASAVNTNQNNTINVINQVIQGSRLVQARRFSTNG